MIFSHALIHLHTAYLLQFSKGRNVALVGKVHPFLHVCFLERKEDTPLHSLKCVQQALNCISTGLLAKLENRTRELNTVEVWCVLNQDN